MDIFEAIDARDMARINKLLKKKKQHANKRRNNNDTPLHMATERGYTDIMEVLIAHGAQVNTSNGSPLNSACQYGRVKAARLLLDNGADPTTGCNIGNTPLHTASAHGNDDIIALLLAHDIDLDARNVDGWTALHRAAYNGKLNVVRVLLRHGADERVKTNANKTAYDFAVSARHYEIAELVRRYKGGVKMAAPGTRKEPVQKSYLQLKKEQLAVFFSKKHDTKPQEVPAQPVTSPTVDNNVVEDIPPVFSGEEEVVSIGEPEGFQSTDVSQESATTDKLKLIKNNLENFRQSLRTNAVSVTNDIKNLPRNLIKTSGDDAPAEPPEDADEEGEEGDECPICFEVPFPPVSIYQCVNGHLFCGRCKDMPNMEKCPQCAVEIQASAFRNRYAEEAIKKKYKK